MERKQQNIKASRFTGDVQNSKSPAISMSYDVTSGQLGPKSGDERQEHISIRSRVNRDYIILRI